MRGPCDERTKKLAAGVRGMAKLIIKMTKTPSSRKPSRLHGEVENLVFGLGWEEQPTVYILYDKTGGAGKHGGNDNTRVIAEALLQITQEQIWQEHHRPDLILGVSRLFKT